MKCAIPRTCHLIANACSTAASRPSWKSKFISLMSGTKEPTYGNGKICYVELPAQDIQQSADFYKAVFNWHVRTRGDGSVAFDDAVNEVSGSWVLNRKPATDPGLMIYVMVDSVAATCEAIIKQCG